MTALHLLLQFGIRVASASQSTFGNISQATRRHICRQLHRYIRLTLLRLPADRTIGGIEDQRDTTSSDDEGDHGRTGGAGGGAIGGRRPPSVAPSPAPGRGTGGVPLSFFGASPGFAGATTSPSQSRLPAPIAHLKLSSLLYAPPPGVRIGPMAYRQPPSYSEL